MTAPYIFYDDKSGYTFKATASHEPAEDGMRPLYTQQSLDAAVLKAKDGSLKKELLTLVLDDNIRGEYTTDSGGMNGESIQCASCGVSEYTACMEGELEHKSDCKWIEKIAAKNKLRAILAGSKQ